MNQFQPRSLEDQIGFGHLGYCNGFDVWRDQHERQYYIDTSDGLRRVGPKDFVAHPVDTRRLTEFFEKHNPEHVRWVDYILASYQGHEQSCWEDLKKKYLYPIKPEEPTWGRGIRKQRWAEYDAQLKEYEQKVQEIDRNYQIENENWEIERKNYVPPKIDTREFLLRALSPGDLSDISPYVPSSSSSVESVYEVQVPAGKAPGEDFEVVIHGAKFRLQVPLGVHPGQMIQFSTPRPIAEAVIIAQS